MLLRNLRDFLAPFCLGESVARLRRGPKKILSQLLMNNAFRPPSSSEREYTPFILCSLPCTFGVPLQIYTPHLTMITDAQGLNHLLPYLWLLFALADGKNLQERQRAAGKQGGSISSPLPFLPGLKLLVAVFFWKKTTAPVGTLSYNAGPMGTQQPLLPLAIQTWHCWWCPSCQPRVASPSFTDFP